MKSPAAPDIVVPDVDASVPHVEKIRRLFAANPDRVFRNREIIALPLGVPETYINPMLKRLSDGAGPIERVAFGRYRLRPEATQDVSSTSTNGSRSEHATVTLDEIAWARPLHQRGVLLATADGRVYVARDLEQVAV